MRLRPRRPHAWALGAWVLVLAADSLMPPPLVAQRFLEGRIPPDVSVQVTERPYTIRGESVEDIYQQLLAGQWSQFRSFYIWNYGPADQGYAFIPGPSGRCSIPDFAVDLRLTMDFPVWEPPAGASTALVEAWDAFHALLVRDFEERRDARYRMLTEYNRIARRFEADCSLLQTELEVMGSRLEQEMVRTERAARERGQRVQIRWPPEGFEARLARFGTATARGGGVELRPDRSRSATATELPEAESLLVDAQREASIPRDGASWLVVAGLRHEGEQVYFGPVIDLPQAGDPPVDPDVPVPYPGLTEVFVSTLAAALDSAGMLDLGWPIAEYVSDLDANIGRTSLAQLLTHRSGIDNAHPDTARDLDWTTGARALRANARFTEPGAIYSYSGYDFPLAVQVLEAVVRRDLQAALQTAVFTPLGMTSTFVAPTSDGSIPMTHTTPTDVMLFLSEWVEGGVRGAPPLAPEPGSSLEPPTGTSTFGWGVWYDEVAGTPRVSLACETGGFQLFGTFRTAFSLWTSGRFPSATWQYLLHGVGEQIGVGAAVIRPIDVSGTGTLDAVRPTCREPRGLRTIVTSAGEPTPSGSWPGDYRNGDQLMRLGDVGGLLAVTNFDPPLAVTHYSGDIYFTASGAQALFPLRLTRDAAGRRYLVLDGRAFIHLDDASGIRQASPGG